MDHNATSKQDTSAQAAGNGEWTGTAGPPEDEDYGAELFVDFAALLAEGDTAGEVPTLLARTDGPCLFYFGKANGLYGDPETGKTWVALAAGAQLLTNGGRFAVIDMDHNGDRPTYRRLHMLGVPEEVLTDRAQFRYVEPEDRDGLLAVVAALVFWGTGCEWMAVVDSVGELLAMMGGNSNADEDVTAALNAVVTPLTKAGAAAVTIDHLAKNTESRNYGATGAVAKRRFHDGAYMRVFRRREFVPGQGGELALKVRKDRNGGVLREAAPAGPRRDTPPDEAAEADAGATGDNDRNLRYWGRFTLTGHPVTENGRPMFDEHGYPRETLTWEIAPPHWLSDPSRGGRPSTGNSVNTRGTPANRSRVTELIRTLCEAKRDGRLNDTSSKSSAHTAVRGGQWRGPFSTAWDLWDAAGRPTDPSEVQTPILTADDPYAQ